MYEKQIVEIFWLVMAKNRIKDAKSLQILMNTSFKKNYVAQISKYFR